MNLDPRRLFGGASGSVFRGMATLAFGSGVGRLVGITAIPALTRLYTPQDFAALAVFTALMAMLSPLVTLRYALALPLPRNGGVAMNLLVLSLGLMLGTTSLLAVLLWMWGAPLLTLISMEILAPWWWLIALGTLGSAYVELLSMWATRERAYRELAHTSITQSFSGALVKIILGFTAVQPLGLLIGQIVAQTAGVVRLMTRFQADFRENRRHLKLDRIRKAAWRYRRFPLWRLPSQFLMALSMQAPMFYMAAIYGPEATGQFGLAVMALTIPVNLLGQSASRALYAEAANFIRTDHGRVLAMCRETQFRLFAIAILPAAVLFFAGQNIFELLFGVEWTEAGGYASILAIALIFQFTSSPLIQVMDLFPNQSAFLKMNAIRFIAMSLVFFTASQFSLPSFQTVLLYSVSSAVFYLSVSLLVFHTLRKLEEI
jgi:O-antigen/teichoic acid export membrane protein